MMKHNEVHFIWFQALSSLPSEVSLHGTDPGAEAIPRSAAGLQGIDLGGPRPWTQTFPRG